MRESTIEAYGKRRIKESGGWQQKFVSPGTAGVPDDIAMWPFGFVDFLEYKAPGEGPKKHQLRDHERRRELNQVVRVLDSKDAVDSYIAECLYRHDLAARSPYWKGARD